MIATHILSDLLSRVTDIGRSLAPKEEPQGTLCDRCESLLLGKGEATGLALGREILDRFFNLSDEEKTEFFDDIKTRFGVAEEVLLQAIEDWKSQKNPDAARRIHFASEPRSQELIRMLNRAPGGTKDLVHMRKDLLIALKKQPDLKQLDEDFSHLFSSWFNRGFLELKRIDWNNTPAQILEKIITYEAVHEINGWNELRLRVAAEDRRLYGFFHPALGAEPLIFVEVAMTQETPRAIGPILSENRWPLTPKETTTAVFYSISNCQKGLRGISFGNFLIKQVVEELRREFPNLSTFVTLSPVPGLCRWVKQMLESDATKDLPEDVVSTMNLLAEIAEPVDMDTDALVKLAAYYLVEAKTADGNPVDPVARFHLGNGACLFQINTSADSSKRGLANSWGIMVNYLYDLEEIERNHEAYANSQSIITSNTVQKMLK